MAENTFGRGTTAYRAFRFEGMVNAEDGKLLLLARRALGEGLAEQPALATWGCSPAFLTQLENDIKAFVDETDAIETAKTDRLKATALRIKTGNGLFVRVEKICNTGKDVYRETNAAKHSDYLIYI